MRRKIDHQRGIAAQRLQIGQLVEFDAIDGFIAADVQIARPAADLPCGRIGQGRETTIFPRCDHVRFGRVFARFLLRLLAPAAGHHKIDGPSARQIHWHDGVFSQAAALHEQNLEIGRHRQQFAQVGFGLFVDGQKLLAAMAHLHHAHAAAVPVQHFGCSLFEDFVGNGGRACREVVRACH